MEIRIEPYTEAHVAAARAFNDRIAGAAEFGLNREVPRHESEDLPICNRHFLVLEGDDVRGGFLLAGFRGWFGDGQSAQVWNWREPLSEGIVNPKYTFISIRILKDIQKRSPYIFALGMGGEDLPFPRLLRGAGWWILPVPFLFRVFSGGRFARELKLLQSGRMKMLARVAAATGVAQAGVAVVHAKSISGTIASGGFTIEKADRWEDWADEVWARFRGECSFSTVRDTGTLPALYPLEGGRIQAYLIRRGGAVVGWSATMNTQMKDHKYFGNLRVGTILDCIAPMDAMKACAALTTKQLGREGVNLVVTNQSHAQIIKAFRSVGFMSARSNYILALSKKFTEAVDKQPEGKDRIHFTRGDSDGRIHL